MYRDIISYRLAENDPESFSDVIIDNINFENLKIVKNRL